MSMAGAVQVRNACTFQWLIFAGCNE